jgi:hypothetical protein
MNDARDIYNELHHWGKVEDDMVRVRLVRIDIPDAWPAKYLLFGWVVVDAIEEVYFERLLAVSSDAQAIRQAIAEMDRLMGAHPKNYELPGSLQQQPAQAVVQPEHDPGDENEPEPALQPKKARSKKVYSDRRCTVCGETFTPRQVNSIICSRRCHNTKYYRENVSKWDRDNGEYVIDPLGSGIVVTAKEFTKALRFGKYEVGTMVKRPDGVLGKVSIGPGYKYIVRKVR